MKKIRIIVLALVLAVGCVFSCVGCGGKGPQGEDIDRSKTQINVYSYNGGFGVEWLDGVKERFEAKYADISLEKGKKGIQILITPLKQNMTTNEVALGYYDVYFAENTYYDELVQENAVLDITSAVTSVSSYDNKSIESKLSNEQKAYFGIKGSDGNNHYYALPHYMGGSGIIYNKEMFDEYGCYLIDGYSEVSAFDYPNCFLGKWGDSASTMTKTAGPNGIKGDSDDGLPATYQEFYMLCNYISSELQQIPMTWNGYRYYNYTNALIGSLSAQNEGADNYLMNYTFNGTASDLVKSGEVPSADGFFTADQMMSAVTLSDSAESRKLLQRQEGKYYALSFMEEVQKNISSWTNSNLVYDPGYTHTSAQAAFIRGGTAGYQKKIGMLVEGVWAMNEAKAEFQNMEKTIGAEYSMNSRDFGWMPLPRANSSIDTENVMVDSLRCLCFASSKVADYKKEVVLDFIQFVNSDAELVKYTQSTNTIKGLKYTLTEEEQTVLSPFGRSLYNYVQSDNTKVVYPYSHATTYSVNPSSFRDPEAFQATIGNTDYTYPMDAFKKGISALDYFNNLK